MRREPGGEVVLHHPAAGLGTALDRPRGPATGRPIGRSRAALLADPDTPRTTGELARRNGLAPATVSHQLGIPHRSGPARVSLRAAPRPGDRERRPRPTRPGP
ncbi:hypothetical protein [Streptomyces xanthii]|uniref:Uncharacterized protein n=1 Tax=Streptomyces xanthii TaxID=2768069 RepID=A0A7H1B456_9ACTN|nr:hypothetical protein [Streptomyces xanthii]QNS03511.1 hypothetical protein IAG42_07605 [Streptomyces xanthii]